jgi:hypothetical protein
MRVVRWLAVIAMTLSAEARAEDWVPPDREVPLLKAVPTVVAVSSVVKNAKDKPEHLVDGKPETAWNSRTGDLVGAWIAFRVPDDVVLTQIDLTVGYDKVTKDGDYFTMNHRVRKVRVSRRGVPLVEHTFDVDVRREQEIPVTAPGGDFEIEVLETLPGSKPRWREVVISELMLWGTLPPGNKRQSPTPVVRVGSLDEGDGVGGRKAGDVHRAPTRALAGPFKTLEAHCQAYLKQHSWVEGCESDADRQDPDNTRCYDTPPPSECDPDDAQFAGSGEIAEVPAPYQAVRLFTSRTNGPYVRVTCNVAIRTGAGWFVAADWFVCADAAGDYGAERTRIDELATKDLAAGGAPEVLVRYTSEDREGRKHPFVLACDLDETHAPRCTVPISGTASVEPQGP